MPNITALEAQLKQAQLDEAEWQARFEKASVERAKALESMTEAGIEETRAQQGYEACQKRVEALKTELESLA